MKITQFSASNFQMLTAINIQPTAPVLLIAGKNEQGKSSIFDALRMGLTTESARVKLKKDYDQLVRDGGKDAHIHIEIADGRTASIALPSGKATYTAAAIQIDEATAEVQRAALPLVIDPAKFAAMPENNRRSFLFSLAGLKCDGPAIVTRMIARECDKAKVDEVAAMLHSGFAAGNEFAKEKAKGARSEWKGVTGETYGEKKADTWKAESPVVDLIHQHAAQADLEKIDASIETLSAEIGGLQAQADAAARDISRAAELTEQAEKKPRFLVKLEADKKFMAELESKVAETKLLVTTASAAPLACPHCSGLLQMVHGVLVQYEEPVVKFDPAINASLAEYEAGVMKCKSAVENDERDLAQAEAAISALAEMAKTKSVAPAAGEIEEKQSAVAALKERKKAAQAELDSINTKKAQAEAAGEKTKQAAGHHATAKAWEKIADALAPDGIPGELLADALAPFNSRLRETSIATGWSQVSIDPDMTIRVAGRVYSLQSESSGWRADSALAEAISHMSGLKFACFDRVDVLDIESRGAFFKWLHRLAAAGDIDTAVCFGTFKALPSLPTATFDARWIERGEIQQPVKEAA